MRCFIPAAFALKRGVREADCILHAVPVGFSGFPRIQGGAETGRLEVHQVPIRAATLAALAAVLLSLGRPPAVGAEGAAPASLPGAADSIATAPDSVRSTARIAYQAAWVQRQAGEFAGAVLTAEMALASIEEALAGDPDAATRRELTDLRSRLAGLRDAARNDASSASSALARGNDADERVLNSPAVEDITLQFNSDVYRYIEFFTGAGRSVFERWLKRSGRYMSLFRSVLQKEGLPPDLAHLVFVESGFNLHARSMSAAVGPWQFLRSTARLFGLTVDRWVDERKDPEKSTVAAARYLKHLYSIFGDWPLALASYNAGEGTVLRAIKRQGTTNYWDLRLPRQTEDYVPQFMAVLAIARDPEKYGFDSIELDDPMTFDEIAFKGTVDLHAIARLAECSYDTLRQLNPAVLRGSATARNGVTTLRVPPGKGEILLQRLNATADLPAANLTLKHRVRSGETIQGIANQYHVSAKRLALANGIGRKRPLRLGMVLTVPASLAPATPPLLEAGDPRASTDYVPPRSIGTPATLEGSSSAEGRSTVRVHRGETLQSIADAHGVTVHDIMSWNHLKSTRVRRGMRLKIRTGDSALVQTSPSDSAEVAKLATLKLRPSRRHRASATVAPGSGPVVVVQPGDTLGEIAHRHGVSIDALKRANGLTSSRIRSGQRLRIPTG